MIEEISRRLFIVVSGNQVLHEIENSLRCAPVLLRWAKHDGPARVCRNFHELYISENPRSPQIVLSRSVEGVPDGWRQTTESVPRGTRQSHWSILQSKEIATFRAKALDIFCLWGYYR